MIRAYLTALEGDADPGTHRYRELEARFVMIAADYAAEHGISAEAWILFGVPRHVVRAAGIDPSSSAEHEVQA